LEIEQEKSSFEGIHDDETDVQMIRYECWTNLQDQKKFEKGWVMVIQEIEVSSRLQFSE
jgi:hypothetical protein